MIRTFKEWKKRHRQKKIKPGDGRPLKPFYWWQMIYRSLFFIRLEKNGTVVTYAVDINYFSENEDVDLYRDNKHFANAPLPASFPVPGGTIEVARTMYGVNRMHYVRDDGTEVQLLPHAHSAEGLRMKLSLHYPRLSKFIGFSAVVILLLSLILGLPQLLSLITQIPFIKEHIGVFDSPIILPNWLNTFLVVLATLATIERTLTLRNHWLIDMDTWWEDLS